MGDFSNDTASAVMNTGSKVVEKTLGAITGSLTGLLKFMVRRFERHTDLKMQREALGLNKQSKLIGYVSMKKLIESGDKITPINFNQPLSKEQYKAFSKYAKRFGLNYSAVKNKGEDGKNQMIVVVKEKDLRTVRDIIEKLNEDAKISIINNNISDKEIQAKLIDEVFRDGCVSFNDVKDDLVFEDVANRMKEDSKTFNVALNRFTERDYSRNEPIYLCERTNPSKYIELTCNLDEFRGQEYTRTDYVVYKDNNEIMKASDKKFENRPQYYWVNLRKEMQVKGGFSDDVLMFYKKEEFENYKELYKEALEKSSIKENEVDYGRDYNGMVTQLKDKLNEQNVIFVGYNHETKNMSILDADTKQPILTDTVENQYKNAISKNYVQQIHNYETLSKLQNSSSLLKQECARYEDMIHVNSQTNVDTTEWEKTLSELKNELTAQENQISKCIEVESSLKDEQAVIVSAYTSKNVKSLHDVKDARDIDEKDITKERKLSDRKQEIAEIKSQQLQTQNPNVKTKGVNVKDVGERG